MMNRVRGVGGFVFESLYYGNPENIHKEVASTGI